jgi:hypothetical protein
VQIYREIYGIEVFDCAALRATLGREQCADNFKLRRCVSCWNCTIGRHHAGIKKVAPTRPPKICLRCGTTDSHRLIGGSLCPSCYNRQSELVRGKNGKGCWPTVTAQKLRWVHALVRFQPAKHCKQVGNLPDPERSGLPGVELIEPGVYFVRMVSTGRDEFSRWMARHHPNGVVIDYDEAATFADIRSAEKSAQ